MSDTQIQDVTAEDEELRSGLWRKRPPTNSDWHFLLGSSFQVHSKFRFPFYYEMCWYVLERYLHCLTKRSYLSQEFRKEPVVVTGELGCSVSLHVSSHYPDPLLLSFASDIETKTNTGSPFSDSQSQDTHEDWCETVQVREDDCEKPDGFGPDGPCSPDSRRVPNLKSALSVDSEDSCNPGSTSLDFIQTPLDSPASEPTSRWAHLTGFELSGLRMLVEKLESLPESKKCVPEGIENPQALLEDMKVGNPRGETLRGECSYFCRPSRWF